MIIYHECCIIPLIAEYDKLSCIIIIIYYDHDERATLFEINTVLLSFLVIITIMMMVYFIFLFRFLN